MFVAAPIRKACLKIQRAGKYLSSLNKRYANVMFAVPVCIIQLTQAPIKCFIHLITMGRFLEFLKIVFLLAVVAMADPTGQGEDVDPGDPEVHACATFAVESFNRFYHDPHVYQITEIKSVRRLVSRVIILVYSLYNTKFYFLVKNHF